MHALTISGHGQKACIQTKKSTQFIATKRKNVPLLVAGDEVEYDEKQGVIVKLLPRKNCLTRNNKPVAANLDFLLLVVAVSPKYQLDLIDRYLVIAQKFNIPIRIIVNKIDLAKNQDLVKLDFSIYEKLGYLVDYISLKSKYGISDLLKSSTDSVNLIVGQSGVGKSSLVNHIMPTLNLKTQGLTSTKSGKHTTSDTVLYQQDSLALIDSPGVREFNLDNLDKTDIALGFIEINALANACKFRNCQHINEPDCAVKTALDAGEISKSRYKSYCRLILGSA